LQDPDLEDAKFQILDFSVPKGQAMRELKIVNASAIPVLNETDRDAMLEVFAEGYLRAQAELAQATEPKAEQQPEKRPDDNQLGLFDRD
jgi:hypothetical protein